MAIDPEELKRRRQQRQQQRYAQNRRTVVKLVIAGIVLALVVVLIVTLAGRKTPSAPDAETTQPSVTGTTAEATTPEEKTVIHLAAAGDLNITEAVVNAGGSDYD